MSFRDRVDSLKSGMVIGAHVRNQDFWAIAFGRPSAFLLLIFIADYRWVTPNRLTHISNILMAAGIAALFGDTHAWFIWSAILLNVSITFDSADGQLARYRGGGTELGSYYDKIADFLGHIPVFAALGWLTYQHTGEAYYLIFALVSLACLMTTGYAKWLAMATLIAHGMQQTAAAPADPRPMSWPEYLGRTFISVFRFAEPDLYFWIGLGLIFDRLPWLMWLLFVTQIPVAVAASVYRGVQIARVDRANRANHGERASRQ
jgi:phosphatidylglycerophosphate synthase